MAPPTLPDLDAFSLHVTIHVEPENVDKFFAAMKPVFDLVCAEEGCLYFEIFQDPASPGTLSWVENWHGNLLLAEGILANFRYRNVSPQWFMANQMGKEYYKEYFAITEPMFIKPREFKILKRVGLPFVVAKDSNFK